MMKTETTTKKILFHRPCYQNYVAKLNRLSDKQRNKLKEGYAVTIERVEYVADLLDNVLVRSLKVNSKGITPIFRANPEDLFPTEKE